VFVIGTCLLTFNNPLILLEPVGRVELPAS
jgi:hypothetical protein